jgi:Uma2 family endonuclease
VTLEDPGIDVFEAPPFVCVEILSPRDETSDLLEELDEYTALGVPHIWVIDPRGGEAFTYSSGRLEEVTGDGLHAGTDVGILLSEVFDRL